MEEHRLSWWRPIQKGKRRIPMDKPGEESQESGGFNWTGPNSCEGPEAGVIRGPSREGNLAQGEPKPQNHLQEVYPGIRKSSKCKKIRGQSELAKEHEGRPLCCLEQELNKPWALCWQLPVGVIGMVWLVLYNHLSFCGSIIMLELTWLPLGNRCMHTFIMFSAWARPSSDFVFTCIQLSYYKLNFCCLITSHSNTFLKWKQIFSQRFSNKPQ